MTRLRLGTRNSALALAQARLVADALGGAEIVGMTTAGDRGDTSPVVEDKSRWVAELERALLDGEIDAAVHSAKDVPGELAEGLEIAAVPARADPRDALCGARSLAALPAQGRVGTGSLRRRSQLLARRADLEVEPVHGNVDTRLRRLAEGEWDAIVLALAGLERLGRGGEAGAVLGELVPAPGQGALAIEARRPDQATRAALEPVNHPAAFACLAAERAFTAALGAGCHTPVGAHAVLRLGERGADGDTARLEMTAFVGLPDGSEWVRDEVEGPAGDPVKAGRDLAARMGTAGAWALLRAAEQQVYASQGDDRR